MRGRRCATATAVAPLPRGVLARCLSRARARLHRRGVDVPLAGGREPWSSAALMIRATRLVSWPERQKLACALEGLVALAERRLPTSPYLRLRHRAVLAQRSALLELAGRLRDPAPLD